jgi:signal transduction histidine kinase
MNLRATATRNKILFGSLATILILVLAFFVRNKRQYAERKKMTDALHNMELEMELSQLKQQAEKEAAIEGQRKSISANLHDEIGANLAALRFFINDQEKRAKNAEAKAVLSDIADEVQTIYIRSREFMHELSKGKNPSNYNVADLLQNLELRFGAQSSVQVHVNADDEEIRKSFTPLQHAEMYRVIREAVANSLKHSGASDIYISLGSDLKGFNFEIRDNGNGTANSKEAGMGMSAMAERLKILKGNFKVEGINTGIVISGNFPITG